MERLSLNSIINYNLQPNSSHFVWARTVYKKETKTLHVIQSGVTCKDYLMDTYIRPWEAMSYPHINHEGQAYLNTPWLAINIPLNNEMAKKRILKFQEWETKQKASVSQFYHDVEKSRQLGQVYYVNFDPQWQVNHAVLSAYFSVMRIYLSGGNLRDIFKSDSRNAICNERNYILQRQTTPYIFDFYMYALKNLYRHSKKIKTPTIYGTQYITHGGSGIFFYTNCVCYDLQYQRLENRNLQWAFAYAKKDENKSNYWAQVYKLYYAYMKRKEKRDNVKMQSLQQKTNRA